jgi:hypothetical protein
MWSGIKHYDQAHRPHQVNHVVRQIRHIMGSICGGTLTTSGAACGQARKPHQLQHVVGTPTTSGAVRASATMIWHVINYF